MRTIAKAQVQKYDGSIIERYFGGRDKPTCNTKIEAWLRQFGFELLAIHYFESNHRGGKSISR